MSTEQQNKMTADGTTPMWSKQIGSINHEGYIRYLEQTKQQTMFYKYALTGAQLPGCDYKTTLVWPGHPSTLEGRPEWSKFKHITDITNSLKIGFLNEDELYEDEETGGEITPSEITEIDIYTSNHNWSADRLAQCEWVFSNEYDNFNDMMCDVEEDMKTGTTRVIIKMCGWA